MSVVLAPLGPFVLLALMLAPVVAVSTIVELWDEHRNTAAFSPGRWEARDGEYWIQLDADGTGDLRVPGDLWTSDPCPVAQGEIEWAFELTGQGRPVAGNLEVDPIGVDYPPCEDFSLWLWASGGYNWDELVYYEADHDGPAMRLVRVDE